MTVVSIAWLITVSAIVVRALALGAISMGRAFDTSDYGHCTSVVPLVITFGREHEDVWAHSRRLGGSTLARARELERGHRAKSSLSRHLWVIEEVVVG